MEIGKQIRKYRLDTKLSQEELAEKIFVTRQTISNWENDKNYPDIKSLLLLSTLFDVSLDILVKGDLDEMKEKINLEDIQKFRHESGIFMLLLAASIILPVPATHFLGIPGFIGWLLVYIVTMVHAIRVEKMKKAHDINTYREIVSFMEGKTLDEIQKSCERGKRPYQEVLLAIGTGLITALVCAIFFYLLKLR